MYIYIYIHNIVKISVVHTINLRRGELFKGERFVRFRLGGDVEWRWLPVTDSHSHQLRALLSQGVQRFVATREDAVVVVGCHRVDGGLATIFRLRVGAKGVEREFEQCHI